MTYTIESIFQLKSDDTSNNHFLNRISSASYFHQVWGLVSLLSPLEFTIALFMDQTSPQSNQVRQFGLRIASCLIEHLLKFSIPWLPILTPTLNHHLGRIVVVVHVVF